MFRKRSYEPEIMDDLTISGEVIAKTLQEISSINNLLGGNSISLQVFQSMVKGKKKISLVDLGCGSGDIMILMADYCRKNNIDATFVGIDANPFIVEYAQQNTAAYPEISYQSVDVLDESFNTDGYDIVHCCLFLHHFNEEELTILLTKFKNSASMVIINDLHRNVLAYWSIKALTSVFSRSYMVRNDAAVSVKRGFKKKELKELLDRLNINGYSLNWRWAFRWQLTY